MKKSPGVLGHRGNGPAQAGSPCDRSGQRLAAPDQQPVLLQRLGVHSGGLFTFHVEFDAVVAV